MGKPGLLTDVRAFIQENPNVDWKDKSAGTQALYVAFNCDTENKKKTMRSYKASVLRDLGMLPAKTSKSPTKKLERTGEQLKLPVDTKPEPPAEVEKDFKYGLTIEPDLFRAFKIKLVHDGEKGSGLIRKWIQSYVDGNL